MPVHISYNIGAGASGNPSEKKAGGFAGIGWGYFYQQAVAKQNENPQYKESLSVSGPEVKSGLRFVLRKINLFTINKKTVHPTLAICFAHLFDLKIKENDTGSLSALFGFAF